MFQGVEHFLEEYLVLLELGVFLEGGLGVDGVVGESVSEGVPLLLLGQSLR